MVTEKLAQIDRYLARRGINLIIEHRPPVDPAELVAAERTLGHELPGDLRNLYARFTNGFELFWEDCRSPNDFDFARFRVPELKWFVERTIQFRDEASEEYQAAGNYFERVEEARAILRRMLSWGVLWDTGGDGNLVCIDFETGQVLFHEREWSFYESYVNGSLIAASLNALIDEWGDVCFLNFPGCPGDCPAHGESAVPEYGRQQYNISRGS